ncbi:vWA domain-containing protein [Maliponia aquimaris]|uniref:VWA domain containing CoxE-like protein n=1 Tax=Maliponia aquimaris TaxID=1673631 RepID=A0A238L4U6_9RHOB|nr:VWA domain-containing protein [Maliponia aquimaris]SMX49870.1 VWA domain containing CoxE-like protein [Maliponia aquimaris]
MIPRALDPFLAFPQMLRAAGLPASPEQTESFIAATGLLGPRSISDIRRAAHAVYGPGPERAAQFDAIFNRVFLGQTLAAPAPGEPEEMPRSYDAGDFDLMPEADEEEPSGADATAAERLFRRDLGPGDEAAMLRAFARALPGALPRRRSRRTASGKGRLADARRAFREMLRRDGELAQLPTRRRRTRQRRVLMLVDVSGSMKAGTDGALRLAHALVQGGERVEAFTLGTRLTRVTRALRHRSPEQALVLASGLVADWDGGTRLGEALAVFLSVPRFASHARGALVIVVSDGLERGGPEALVAAMQRLHGLAWSVLWLSPLAAYPAYRPETGAMTAILPLLDRLGDGSDPGTIAGEILHFSKGARR